MEHTKLSDLAATAAIEKAESLAETLALPVLSSEIVKGPQQLPLTWVAEIPSYGHQGKDTTGLSYFVGGLKLPSQSSEQWDSFVILERDCDCRNEPSIHLQLAWQLLPSGNFDEPVIHWTASQSGKNVGFRYTRQTGVFSDQKESPLALPRSIIDNFSFGTALRIRGWLQKDQLKKIQWRKGADLVSDLAKFIE